MTIETVKRPYELLVRWREGKITGAHVGFELTAIEDGKVLSTTALPVIPVNIGQGVGFPLADILEQVHSDALIGMDTLNAECEKHLVAISNLEGIISKHEATITALTAELEIAKQFNKEGVAP